MNKRMSIGSFAIVVSGLAISWGSAAIAQQVPSLVTAPVDQAFVPLGFDDNDDVEIVLHGHFPSTCYKVGPVKATVDMELGQILIESKAYEYRSDTCVQALISFTQTIKVGNVVPGSYQIKVVDRPEATTVPLEVTESRSPNPDDFLYAPVAATSLDKTDSGDYTLTISGEFPYMYVGCMVLREVKTYMSPGNTLVVLPVAELTDGRECEPQSVTKRFSATKVIGALAEGDYLVHVRVLEGNSLNRFVEVY
jgi:hypothetical protein